MGTLGHEQGELWGLVVQPQETKAQIAMAARAPSSNQAWTAHALVQRTRARTKPHLYAHLAHILRTWASPIVDSRPKKAMVTVQMEGEVIDVIYLLII